MFTTGDDTPPHACPVGRVGLSRDWTIIGAPALVRVCDGDEPTEWLTPMQQCRLLMLEEAISLQRVIGAAAAPHSDPLHGFLPVELSCGTLDATVASDDSLWWSVWGCDTVVWFNAEEIQTWNRKPVYALKRSVGNSSSFRYYGTPYGFAGSADCEATRAFLNGSELDFDMLDSDNYFHPRGEM